MRSILTIVLATCLAAVATGAFATEPQLLEEIEVRGDVESSNTTSLTIREVRESAARDMGEALSLVPGITPVRKGAIANDVVLRGLQRDNINVLLDGARLYGGCPSRMDSPAFHFDFAQVEQVKIEKGPYNLTRPGHFGGSVNAETRATRPGAGLRASFTYGTDDLVNASLAGSYGGKRGDGQLGYAYKYSLPYKSADGKRITEIYPATSPNRYRPGAIDSRAYDIQTLWAKGGVNFGTANRTELFYSYQDAEHVLYPALLMDADYDRTHLLNWVTDWNNVSATVENIELQVYANTVDHLMHDKFRASSLPSMMVTRDYMMQTEAETSTYGGSLKGRFRSNRFRTEAGLDTYRRNWKAVNESAMFTMADPYRPQPMIPDVDINNYGLFADVVWALDSAWSLGGGVRVDLNEFDARALDDTRLNSLYQPYYPGIELGSSGDHIEPGANLRLNWKATESTDLFLGVASVVRFPDQQELFIGLQRGGMGTSWIGNPALSPSRNNQADIGIKLTAPAAYATFSLFYSRIDDYIYLVDRPDPDGPGPLIRARSYGNIDARFAGGELFGQVSLPADFYLSAGLDYTRAENRATSTPLAEIPPFSGQAGLRYDVDTWFAEALWRFAARQERVDAGLNEDETPGWGTMNLKAGLKVSNWQFFAGVDNLFDRYYLTHLSYQRDPFRSGVKVPEPGRFLYLTVIFEY